MKKALIPLLIVFGFVLSLCSCSGKQTVRSAEEVAERIEVGMTFDDVLSIVGKNLRLPLCFGLRPQGPCRVGTGESGLVLSEEGNPAGLSSCSGGLRPLVELCVEPAGISGNARR